MKQTIDSIRPPQRFRQPPATRSSDRDARGPLTPGARFANVKSTPPRRRHGTRGLLLAAGISPILVGTSLLGAYAAILLVAYGLAVFIMKVPSRYTFTVALMALVYMVGAQLAAAADIAQALALQAYLLLAVGAISLAREVKSASRLWFKKH